jgi:hypothetical protein
MADEIELQGCEHCQKEFPIEEMTMMPDCWICQSCYDGWKQHHDKCQHSFVPHVADGDEGQYCERCCGFVRTGDFQWIIER